jgi:hypothetical protein
MYPRIMASIQRAAKAIAASAGVPSDETEEAANV